MAKTGAERAREFRLKRAGDLGFREKERARHKAKRANMKKSGKAKVRNQTRTRVQCFRERVKTLMNASVEVSQTSQYSNRATKMKAVHRYFTVFV
jgi:hypothetical protein